MSPSKPTSKKAKAPSSSSRSAPPRPASGPAYWLFKTELWFLPMFSGFSSINSAL